jgi:regulator of nucleoside diphosphate kinase
MPADVVNLGSEVTYRDETTGCRYTITLALPHEADVPAGRVSLLTPVGTALIGRAQGATVPCEFPVGTIRQLTVLRVDQSPCAGLTGRTRDAAPSAHAATA